MTANRQLYDGISEVTTLLSLLKNDPNFIIRMKTTEFGTLVSLLLVPALTIPMTDMYCDVLIADATHKCNRFNMPLLLLTCVDNQGCSFLVAACLVSSETEEDYFWCFEMIFQVIPQFRNLRVFITDKQPSLYNPLLQLVPHINHQLCLWHMENSITKALRPVLGELFESFKEEFIKVQRIEEEHSFNDSISQLIKKHPLASQYLTVHWLPLSKKWANCYLKNYQNLGMTTTQRGESMNRALKRYLDYQTPLHLLPGFLLSLVTKRKEYSNFITVRLRETFYSTDDFIVKELYKNLASYPRDITDHQYELSLQYAVLREDQYFFRVKRNEKMRTVILSIENNFASQCDCFHIIRFKLPCRHVLAVYKSLSIPCGQNEIGMRWKLDYSTNKTSIPFVRDTFNSLTSIVVTTATTTTTTTTTPLSTPDSTPTNNDGEEQENNIERSFQETLTNLEDLIVSNPSVALLNDLKQYVKHLQTIYVPGIVTLRDPPSVSSKGRKKSSRGVSKVVDNVLKKTSAVCSNCKNSGHYKTTCPQKK
jgi:hypothetical protein